MLLLCTDKSCYYCAEHPIRLPVEVFRELSFLPLPLMDHTKEHYQKFADIFWANTWWKGSSILRSNSLRRCKAEIDREHKGILVKAKVRAVVFCGECHKPRCIYSNSKLSPQEKVVLDCMKETNLYTCGSPLFSEGTPLASTVITREALTCGSPIETQYYSAVLVHFPPVCYYCGLGEETLSTMMKWKSFGLLMRLFCLCVLYAKVRESLLFVRGLQMLQSGPKHRDFMFCIIDLYTVLPFCIAHWAINWNETFGN